MTGWLKLLLELGPLAVFFVVFTVLAPEAQTAAQIDELLPNGAEAAAAADDLRLQAEIDALVGATVAFMISLFISLAISYGIEKKVSRVAVFTAIVVLVTGALTIYLRDGDFIKMKPTIAYGFFGAALLFGWLRGRSYLQDLMGELAEMDQAGWLKLARNWALFFVFCAILNEVIWRFYDTETWVWTKTFVYVPLIGIFALSQAPMMAAHSTEEGAST